MNTDWSILRPSDFSLAGECLSFTDNVKLDNSESKLTDLKLISNYDIWY